MSKTSTHTICLNKVVGTLRFISALYILTLLPYASAQEEVQASQDSLSTSPVNNSEPAQSSSLAPPLYYHREDLQYHLSKQTLSLISITLNGIEVEVPIVKYNARQAIVKGVAIIIGDVQPQGYIDSSLHLIAKTLPDWGWHTVLVTPSPSYVNVTQALNDTLNAKQSNEQATSDESTNNGSDSQAGDILNSPQTDISANSFQAPSLSFTHTEYVAFLASLTEALTTHFSQQLGYKVVYAKGKSAAGLVSLFASSNNNGFDALVIENTYWPVYKNNEALAQQLSTLTIPVLDLVSKSDNKWAQHTKDQRAVAVRVNLKPMYRQRDVSSVELGSNSAYFLAKEVSSWTHFMGW